MSFDKIRILLARLQTINNKKDLNEVIKNILSQLGLIITAYGIFVVIAEVLNQKDRFTDLVSTFFSNGYWVYVVLILIVINILLKAGKTRLSQKIIGSDISIVIEVCDIFKQKGDWIISSDRAFNTNIQDGLIKTSTLHGQLIKRYFFQRTKLLDLEINEFLHEKNIDFVEENTSTNRNGKPNIYALGTTVKVNIVHSNNRSNNAYLAAFENAYSEREEIQIREYLNGIWATISKERDIDNVVNIAVIGTLREKLPIWFTPERSIIEILKSFVKESARGSFCKGLRVCIFWTDLKDFDFSNLEKELDYITTSYYTQIVNSQ